IVADGGGGICRTCGVLRSNQLIIRQHTPMLQLYPPSSFPRSPVSPLSPSNGVCRTHGIMCSTFHSLLLPFSSLPLSFHAYIPQIVADGGGGSCRTCGVLRSNQLIIRQHTPMLQFYEPLLQDRVHWLATSRTSTHSSQSPSIPPINVPLQNPLQPFETPSSSFSDLQEAIIWAQQHDKAVLRMVEAANRFAYHACTWHGRMLYWALLLVKYQDVMAEPESVSKPAQLCLKP
ncbi:unnamed protein product, partial [Closterium sp. NIES-54]